MRVGVVVLPVRRWPQAREVWTRLDRLGYAHAWTYDHLTWRHHRDSAWFSAVPTLTAAAAVTSRIRLGPMVATPNFRHPVTLAKELMTLDDVSGGRLLLGLGSGGTGFDADALGGEPWSRVERTARFEEFTRLLDELLTAPATTARGRFYAAVEARGLPGCVQRPRVPFVVSAIGPRALALTAELGQGWVTYGEPSLGSGTTPASSLAAAKEQSARLDDLLVAAGRDPSSVDRYVLVQNVGERPMASLERFRDYCGRYAEIGFTDVVFHHPEPGDPRFDDPPEIVEEVAEARPETW